MKPIQQLSYPAVKTHAQKNQEFLTGNFNGRRMYTALQPIYSIAHKRAVGYEALLRVKERQKTNGSAPPVYLKTQKTP